MDNKLDIPQTLPEITEAQPDPVHSIPRSAPLPIHESIIAALRTVYDPEIPVNIYDLGLIYRIDVDDHSCAEIDMTLTAPGCPVASEMVTMARSAVSGVEGIAKVDVRLVFDPPWDRSMLSEEAKVELGFVDLM